MAILYLVNLALLGVVVFLQRRRIYRLTEMLQRNDEIIKEYVEKG